MAKMLNKMLRNLSVRNAPSGGSGSSRGAGSGFNRDPKAIQVKKVGYQINENAGGGSGDNFEGPIADFDMITEAIRRDSYLTQAVMKYTELIFKSGYSIVGKNEQALEYLDLRLGMMAVATGIPTRELWKGIAEDIVRYSNCFIVKARAKGGQGLPPGINAMAVPPSKDPVVGYFRLPPQTIEISRDDTGTVIKYKQEVDGGGDAKEFRPEDMIHIKVNVPSGRAFGDPFIAPVLDDIRLLRKIEENAGLLMYRHIFPLLAYKIGLPEPGYEASDEELEEFRAVIDDMPTDGAIVLPERHSIEPVKVEAIDGKPYLEYFENRVFSGLGLSQVDFGRGDTANRNTADAMTGTKADRVKGWQLQIQDQIDKYLIEELLVEGGFDPIVNPEFDCDFVFNEIELESIIKKESHEIFKFTNNAITWEEMREGLGEEPVAEESHLFYQMIQMALGEQKAEGSAQAANNNKPENQHGKRSGPKRSTESLQESAIEIKESPLLTELTRLYLQVEKECIEALEKFHEKKSTTELQAKALLGSFNFSKKKMVREALLYAKSEFENGMSQAQADTGQKVQKCNTSLAHQTISSYIEESFTLLEERLISTSQSKLSESKIKKDQIFSLKSVFESLRFKMRDIASSCVMRSYNYGYALSLMSIEEEFASITPSENACNKCQVKAQETISLKQLSSLDEVAIFYRIPPWHPNCECKITSHKGGER